MSYIGDEAMTLKKLARLALGYLIRVDIASRHRDSLHEVWTLEMSCVSLGLSVINCVESLGRW